MNQEVLVRGGVILRFDNELSRAAPPSRSIYFHLHDVALWQRHRQTPSARSPSTWNATALLDRPQRLLPILANRDAAGQIGNECPVARLALLHDHRVLHGIFLGCFRSACLRTLFKAPGGPLVRPADASATRAHLPRTGSRRPMSGLAMKRTYVQPGLSSTSCHTLETISVPTSNSARAGQLLDLANMDDLHVQHGADCTSDRERPCRRSATGQASVFVFIGPRIMTRRCPARPEIAQALQCPDDHPTPVLDFGADPISWMDRLVHGDGREPVRPAIFRRVAPLCPRSGKLGFDQSTPGRAEGSAQGCTCPRDVLLLADEFLAAGRAASRPAGVRSAPAWSAPDCACRSGGTTFETMKPAGWSRWPIRAPAPRSAPRLLALPPDDQHGPDLERQDGLEVEWADVADEAHVEPPRETHDRAPRARRLRAAGAPGSCRATPRPSRPRESPSGYGPTAIARSARGPRRRARPRPARSRGRGRSGRADPPRAARPDSGSPMRAEGSAGQVLPVEGDELDGDRDAEGGDGKVLLAKPQGRDADDGGRRAGRRHCPPRARPRREARTPPPPRRGMARSESRRHSRRRP